MTTPTGSRTNWIRLVRVSDATAASELPGPGVKAWEDRRPVRATSWAAGERAVMVVS